MKTRIKLFVCAIFMSTLQIFAQNATVKVRTDDGGWNTSIVSNPDCIKSKSVLLIGDSHVERYYPVVSKTIKESFCCSKFTTGRSLGDPKFIDGLKNALGNAKFDIICFNNGLHDVKYTAKEYAKYLPKVYRLLKKNNPNVKILWITTTARREKNNLDSFDQYNYGVNGRNKTVTDFCFKKNIQVIPFSELSLEHKEFYVKDGIHFNDVGVNAQAKMISEEILKYK